MATNQDKTTDVLSPRDLSLIINKVAQEVLDAYRKGQQDQHTNQHSSYDVANDFAKEDTNYLVLTNNYIQKKVGLLQISIVENREISKPDIDNYYKNLFGNLNVTS